MRYRVTCDVVINAFATVTVDAKSPEEAAEKARAIVNIEDLDGDPTFTGLASIEADESEVEELD
jgi:hypothetical protein